jgi:levoglucosan dehydrogenase
MIRVGIVGTSPWADAMYLPALTQHPLAEVVAVCGRNRERAENFADRWKISGVYTDYRQMIENAGLEAIIVATTNDAHYPITMAALEAGLHVLCEKPLALNAKQAREMADRATAIGVKNMVPFTYRYMPSVRYLKRLIDDGYIGHPYHLHLRYYADYGRKAEYNAFFDSDVSGAGVIADLGPHWFHLARWFYGEISGLSCTLSTLVQRPNKADGSEYTRADDSAVVTVQFTNGAYGVLQMSTLCWEGTKFGQTHHLDFHGSDGTLYSEIDWDRVQEVHGVKGGEAGQRDLPIPDDLWNGARRDTVHNTYRDVFRTQDNMAREFITAIAEDKPVYPDFNEGARVQALIDASVQSAKNGSCWVEV